MGPPEGSSMAAEAGKAPAIKRELSVEDLFAPLNRLDVRHPSSAADASPTLKPRASVLDDARPSADASPNPTHRVSVFETHFASQQQAFTRPDATLVSTVDRECFRNPNAPAAKLSSCFMLDMAPIPEEAGSGISERLSTRMHGSTVDCIADEVGSATGVALAREQSRTKSLSTASVSDTGLQMQGNSSSEEDQQIVDDRKQRRMLSNRESARRSRLRKQQHLDELRGHVAQLRAQNSQMLSSFNLASQQFAQITEENRQLRSEAMELSHKLQRLHHTVASRRANNGLRLTADSQREIQAPQYQHS